MMDMDLATGRIHAQIRGSGRPVLILHGGGLDHRHMLDALEPVFTDRPGWQRLYIDLPGHGRSTADTSVRTQDDVLAMLSGFADRAFDGAPFAVIGESRGSYLAMGLAHTRPKDLSGLMLIVADAGPRDTVADRPEHQTLVAAAASVAETATPDSLARFNRLVVQTPEILRKIEDTKLPALAQADQALARRIADSFDFSFDLTNPDRIFDKPALIVNGRQDAMSGYRDMMLALDRFPRATFAVLDSAGHSLAWERPDLFKALTLDWLDRMA